MTKAFSVVNAAGVFATVNTLKSEWVELPVGSWLELMSSTGLRDSKEKEIFESDVVCLPNDGPRKLEAEIIWGFCGWEFRWIDPQLARVRGRESEPIFRNIHLWEVIGNIYENPELLRAAV